LTWGVVDGGFTREEVQDLASTFVDGLDQDGVSPEVLIDFLREHRLLFDLPSAADRIHRTRSAEAIRLLARLRQIFEFPQWRTGPTLVSDFRYSLRPRVYPRRDVSSQSARETWAQGGVLSAPYDGPLKALFPREGLQALSGFQVRAVERVLRDLSGTWDRGMIVTVGTGSGKTLAFYIPALAHIATLVRIGSHWTKAIAIYPRNELLKDQFSEVYMEARRLDQFLAQAGRRPITIGAFFGPTPTKASVEAVEAKEWGPLGDGYLCPFLRCPLCQGELKWSREDLAASIERLVCVTCGARVDGDEVLLTRQRMQQTPPDVLFTSTEMLNRIMTDSYSAHVFGVNAVRSPQLVLLDEVHTYEGTHGAQVAMLLRRWRHALRGRVQFTGLSATLRNASAFFAQLTGLREGAVEEVTPFPLELEEEGVEYMLALRGDPVSKTSLLSTSIQTGMLLRRVLDPRSRDHTPSLGMYGRKVFVFTDDLDVTNRLFHNLLDAEGVDENNIPKPGKIPLASFRSRGRPDNPQRMLVGQSWYLSEEIGHPEGLTTPLLIGRTSSQDVGVDRASDVIVATAALEVGYNDQELGAILQHKAPRDAASFIQRKGRAGRNRVMRPWTVVVLSDYGRDRIAYQGYDSLFNPALPARTLPISNRYVMRIQAVYSLMEWIGGRIAGVPKGSVYLDLSGPSVSPNIRARQMAEARVLRELLEGDQQLADSLARHLKDALSVDSSVVAALLWEAPRSLMTDVAPTLLRRLESGWSRVGAVEGESALDFVVTRQPAPEFIPASLFSDLNLPEVTVLAKPRASSVEARPFRLSVEQAIRTLVPGKVTRRFAVSHAATSHWIPLPQLNVGDNTQTVPVEDLCVAMEDIGRFDVRTEVGWSLVRCIRPWVYRPAVVPKNVSPTSNARPIWQSQLLPEGNGVLLDIPATGGWDRTIQEIRVFGHYCRSHTEVRRFATGCDASVRLRQRNSPEVSARVTFISREDGGPAAVGFAAKVDGIRFVIRLPKQTLVRDAEPSMKRSFRAAYFRHRVTTDQVLSAQANQFQLDWLYQVYLALLVEVSATSGCSIEQANPVVAAKAPIAAAEVLRVLFEARAMAEDDGVGDDAGSGAVAAGHSMTTSQNLVNDLVGLFHLPAVVGRLSELAGVLWLPPDPQWERWAGQRYQATLGGALIEACRQMCPEAATDDLTLDIESGNPGVHGSDATSEVWLTEATIGGGGVVEEIVRRYSEDPRRFFTLVSSALGPSDYELTDIALKRTLGLIRADGDVAKAARGVRDSRRHMDQVMALETLGDVLASKGVVITRGLISALHARVFRPGASDQTDIFLAGLVTQWDELESRLGVEVDARVFSYLASESKDLSEALAHIDPALVGDRVFRFHAIYGLLWPRGDAIRSIALVSFNPYTTLPPPDRRLVLDQLLPPSPLVDLESPAWRDRVLEGLRALRSARLTAKVEQRDALRDALLSLAVDPLEVEYLHLYPQVDGVDYTGTSFVVALGLREAVQ